MSKIYDLSVRLGATRFRIGRALAPDENELPNAFRYDETWMQIGFSLGSDLPLIESTCLLSPKPGRNTSELFSRNRTFGFFADTAPGCWLGPLAKKAHLFDLKAPIPDPAVSPLNFWAFAGHKNHRFSALDCGLDPSEERESFNAPLEKKKLSLLVRALENADENFARLKREDIALLLDHTSDIGGRRIKATFSDAAGRQRVLRARARSDAVNTPLWTAIASSLARDCGLRTLPFEYLPVAGYGAYIEERFDRDGTEPLFCLSAATLAAPKSAMKAISSPKISFLDVADIINAQGSAPKKDLQELFSRLLFATLTTNRRETPENIWFYRENGGWRLAPLSAPFPGDSLGGAAQLAMPIAGNDSRADPLHAIEYAKYFGLTSAAAKSLCLSFSKVVHTWRERAQEMRADITEIAAVQGAFFE